MANGTPTSYNQDTTLDPSLADFLKRTLALKPSQRGTTTPPATTTTPPATTPALPAPATEFKPFPSMPTGSYFDQAAASERSKLQTTASQMESDAKKREEDAKREAERKAEEEKKQRDRANFSAIKRGERADALLAGNIANKAFGGRPDAPVNPNSRRISPASTEQRQYDITKRLLFNAAQERRREINQ
jgi:DNA topoisomerase VI subunit B